MEKRTWFKALFGGQGMVMETRFSPARKDVERYQGLRTLNMDLNHRMTKTIPRQAYDDVGRAIGILRKGVLVFDNEDMTSVLMDCCLYDWIKGGKNIVQRYSEQHPAKPETDEHYLLNACLRARYPSRCWALEGIAKRDRQLNLLRSSNEALRTAGPVRDFSNDDGPCSGCSTRRLRAVSSCRRCYWASSVLELSNSVSTWITTTPPSQDLLDSLANYCQ